MRPDLTEREDGKAAHSALLDGAKDGSGNGRPTHYVDRPFK